jgi:hypothetical protein
VAIWRKANTQRKIDDAVSPESEARTEIEMNRLTSKMAVVTGASKGIGAAIPKGLAEAGVAVAVNYSGGKHAERKISGIASGGGWAIAIQADVSKAGDDPDDSRGAQVFPANWGSIINISSISRENPGRLSRRYDHEGACEGAESEDIRVNTVVPAQTWHRGQAQERVCPKPNGRCLSGHPAWVPGSGSTRLHPSWCFLHLTSRRA